MTFPSNLLKPAHVEWSSGWVGDQASLGGCDWRGERELRRNKPGKHRPTKHLPDRSKRVRGRHVYFKRNSGGRVIFGWNCTLQDVTSQASHISALRLIASGK